ncbi:leucyl aminopeptidase [Roseateles sp. DB2]|uniref:leucyl aminopeptidase n=1 Tax=Roseateles sp. DB2 TaxID=3453717 RepID=UPI003EECD725
MEFRLKTMAAETLADISADALIVILGSEPQLAHLDTRLATLLTDAMTLGDFEAKAGRSLTLQQPRGLLTRRLVLCAAGRDSTKAARAALQQAWAQLKGHRVAHAAVVFLGFEHADGRAGMLAEQFVLTAREAAYVYRHTRPDANALAGPALLTLIALDADADAASERQQGLTRGQAIAAGMELARECANRPANIATPSHLAACAQGLADVHGLRLQLLDRKAVQKLGMGSFLSVAQGSDEPLRFIVARYEGAPRTQAPLVLVGKGITFDSGGISLKPAEAMEEMKFDMGGAAAVLGTLRAVAELKPRLNLVVLIAACENMPGGRAVKPGDVVTSLSGQTIEVLNTDAEGRLVLCDALTYAERFKPAAVIDVATLTGACHVALADVRSGLFTDDDALGAALMAAGETALDPCWRMPLDDDYADSLASHFADVANVGGPRGGAILAAKFLQRFAGSYRWAHLDIAGTAWTCGATKGSTGRPVALLTHFLLSQAAPAPVPGP